MRSRRGFFDESVIFEHSIIIYYIDLDRSRNEVEIVGKGSTYVHTVPSCHVIVMIF